MIIEIQDDFDLQKIADSGQCFRFNKCGDGYSVVAGNQYLFIKDVSGDSGVETDIIIGASGDKDDKNILGGRYELSCNKKEFEAFWKNYFDLNSSYSDIRSLIDKAEDEYLYNASEFGQGIRILQQDPWEMLISFIISQRKNIPAIKASIEKICALAGHKIAVDAEGNDVFSFPTPKELSKLTVAQLSGCSLGYRDKYVYQAAQDVVSGAVNLESWKEIDDDALMQKLLALYGVGVKVANCEILFGYHRLDAFPKDVWINKVLDSQYPQGFLFDKYKPYNGVMQQYLFFYSRTNGAETT
ncbi:DNA-3-methyladenine glycosylase family protein [Butyrivibrio sp. VCB2006]|uniref:DNA-3-methyladenine glycosylase family protein n=1 Tax=Butyrivibrio sp. VCB2006 TaxID=1280679 RepID=UPI0003F511A1|nr:DNA glycosylase [Butyrivibrio sp. VCB2006]